MLDKTDGEIIGILKKDARILLKDIGEQVHLTGQAVSNRIQRLEKLGVIQGYTAILDESKLGNRITAYITVFMKTTNHLSFHQFIKSSSRIIEANRISGDGCYMLKVIAPSEEELNPLLDQILTFGTYRICICIGKIK